MNLFGIAAHSDLGIAVRLVIACVLGGALGIQRELTRHPAGLRTHMLVALSSAGMMMLALMMRERTGAGSDIDVSRVIQGLVTGVGFIGAGAIMREGVSVYGITTAASLWVACALGIMVGLDAFMLAVATTIVATLLLLIPVHYHGRSDDNGGAPHPLGR